jgi:hypothetical protein
MRRASTSNFMASMAVAIPGSPMDASASSLSVRNSTAAFSQISVSDDQKGEKRVLGHGDGDPEPHHLEEGVPVREGLGDGSPHDFPRVLGIVPAATPITGIFHEKSMLPSFFFPKRYYGEIVTFLRLREFLERISSIRSFEPATVPSTAL